MAVNLNFGLQGPAPNIGNALTQGFQQGRQVAQQRNADNALSAYQANPSDPGAMNALLVADPARATAVMTAQKFQQDRADKATQKTAAAGIVDGQGNVNLSGVGSYIRATGDVAGGLKLHEFAKKASDEQKKQWADSASHLASFGMTIKGQTPDPAARKAAALADPTLSHFGITPEMINSTDFSDQGLDKFIAGQSAIKDTLSRQDDDAKDARNAATDAETARHHRVLEGFAGAGVGIRKQLANLAAKRGGAITGNADLAYLGVPDVAGKGGDE